VRFESLLKVLCFVAISGMFTATSSAQESCEVCAERYVELAKDRRLQTEIDYLLPTDTLDLDRSKKKETPDGQESSDGNKIDLLAPGKTGWFLISAVILFGIAFVIFQNSAGGLVSFSSKPQDGKRTKNSSGAISRQTVNHNDLPQSDAAFLAEIEEMNDRRRALHLLTGRLLAKAAEKAGIRPGRSWTARESLKALPCTSVHIDSLRHINRQAELAWFGGRHVEDGIFEDCLTRARTMLRTGMTA